MLQTLESNQIPDRVQRDPRLLEVWKRCRHILSPSHFEERYHRTLLLPLEWPKLRKQVALLEALIGIEPGIIPPRLAEKSGIKEAKCREILYSREWIEWYSRRYLGSSAYCFFLNDDESGKKLIPEEIRVEYLVAELERLGFEFRVTQHNGTILYAKLPQRQPTGSTHYVHEYSEKITQYILTRDGYSPA